MIWHVKGSGIQFVREQWHEEPLPEVEHEEPLPEVEHEEPLTEVEARPRGNGAEPLTEEEPRTDEGLPRT